jgi:1L-myo-inositol 1-phosphate cytidylyltransferase / CDP-L-myo-inositol myo-inositolphosphotransferase
MQEQQARRQTERPQRLAAVAQMPRIGVVLAAGRSERLSSVTGGGSKGLARLGGVPLVERAVRSLLLAGLEEVVVVVGYQAGAVASVAKRVAPGRVRVVYAPDWQRGNGASFAAAEKALGPRDDLFVLVTMDHIFGEGALETLVRTGAPAALVDGSPSPEVWAEGTRVLVKGGAAYAFSKELSREPVDCGAFLLPREVFAAARDVQAEGDHSLSGCLTRLAGRRPMRAVEMPLGSWWQDVDTPGDLKDAKRRLRRSLTKASDGPVSRYLNRPVSTRLSAVAVHTGLGPNVISILAAAVGMLGAWFLVAGAGIAGALAVHASSVLDGVDGEVARLKLRATPHGALLDGILDRVVDAAVIGALGVWAMSMGESPYVVLWLVAGAAALSILSMASKDRISSLGLFPAPEGALGWLLGGRDGRLLLVAVYAAFGQPLLALIVVIVTSGATLVLRLALVIRRSY